MGYYVMTEESELRIRAEDKKLAYQAVCAINAPEYNHLKRGGSSAGGEWVEVWYSWMPADYPSETETLEDVLELLGFEIAHDDNGDIIGVSYDNKTGSEDIFMLAMAPYVEDGSYILWLGEDGHRWMWKFQNGTMLRHDVKGFTVGEGRPIEYYTGYHESPNNPTWKPVELGVLA